MNILNENEIKERLGDISGWKYNGKEIESEIVLKDFSAVMNLVNKAADFAEEMDHHPDIFIHSWNKVKFTLSTHSAGGITEKDINLAARINELKANIT